MILKCGREEFELTAEDLIMYNGACYQLVTRLTSGGWNSVIPVVAKAKAEKLIKDGKLRVVKPDRPRYKALNLVYYSI